MKTGKAIILSLLILLSAKAFAQRDSIPLIIADSLKAVYIYADTGKAINRTDAQGRKQGLWEKRYANGKLRYRGHFKDNNPTGVFKYYWDNDSVQNIAQYSDNGKVAYARTFYENGGVFTIGKFINRLRDSIWLFYDADFKLYKKEQYALGKKDGKSITFYGNSNVLESKTYKNDIENGPWQQYFPDGQLKLDATYVNGKREGLVKVFSEGNPDTPIMKGYYRNDCKNGKWVYFSPENNTWDTVTYKNDKLINDAKYKMTNHRMDSLRQQYEGVQQQLDSPGSLDQESQQGGGGR